MAWSTERRRSPSRSGPMARREGIGVAAEVDQSAPSAPMAGHRWKGIGATAVLDLPVVMMEAGRGRPTCVVEARHLGAPKAGHAESLRRIERRWRPRKAGEMH
jgi:hypothetical protein